MRNLKQVSEKHFSDLLTWATDEEIDGIIRSIFKIRSRLLKMRSIMKEPITLEKINNDIETITSFVSYYSTTQIENASYNQLSATIEMLDQVNDVI